MITLANRFKGSKLFALTALFVALAGCAVGPDYEQPKNTLSADFANQTLLQQRVGVRISVAAEATDAYFRVRGAQQRIAVAEEQVHTEENLLSLVQARMGSGLATHREQAQSEDRLLLTARDQLAQLRANDARAAVATFRALGGGWSQDELSAKN